MRNNTMVFRCKAGETSGTGYMVYKVDGTQFVFGIYMVGFSNKIRMCGEA